MTIHPHSGIDDILFGTPRETIISKLGSPFSEYTVCPNTPQSHLTLSYPQDIGLGFHIYKDHGMQTISVHSRIKDVVLLGRKPLDLCKTSHDHVRTIKEMINDIGHEFREGTVSCAGHIISLPELKISFHFSFPETPETLSFIQIWGPHVECWFETTS